MTGRGVWFGKECDNGLLTSIDQANLRVRALGKILSIGISCFLHHAIEIRGSR